MTSRTYPSYAGSTLQTVALAESCSLAVNNGVAGAFDNTSDRRWAARAAAGTTFNSPTATIGGRVPGESWFAAAIDWAGTVLTIAQIFVDEILTDRKFIDRYGYEAPMRPPRFLLAQGDPEGTDQHLYMDDKHIWLEGQAIGFALRICRTAYDTFRAEGDKLYAVIWGDAPYIAVVRDGVAMALIACDGITAYDEEGEVPPQDGIPAVVYEKLLQLRDLVP